MRVTSYFKIKSGSTKSKSGKPENAEVIRSGPDKDGEVFLQFDDGVKQYVKAEWISTRAEVLPKREDGKAAKKAEAPNKVHAAWQLSIRNFNNEAETGKKKLKLQPSEGDDDHVFTAGSTHEPSHWTPHVDAGAPASPAAADGHTVTITFTADDGGASPKPLCTAIFTKEMTYTDCKAALLSAAGWPSNLALDTFAIFAVKNKFETRISPVFDVFRKREKALSFRRYSEDGALSRAVPLILKRTLQPWQRALERKDVEKYAPAGGGAAAVEVAPPHSTDADAAAKNPTLVDAYLEKIFTDSQCRFPPASRDVEKGMFALWVRSEFKLTEKHKTLVDLLWAKFHEEVKMYSTVIYHHLTKEGTGMLGKKPIDKDKFAHLCRTTLQLARNQKPLKLAITDYLLKILSPSEKDQQSVCADTTAAAAATTAAAVHTMPVPASSPTAAEPDEDSDDDGEVLPEHTEKQIDNAPKGAWLCMACGNLNYRNRDKCNTVSCSRPRGRTRALDGSAAPETLPQARLAPHATPAPPAPSMVAQATAGYVSNAAPVPFPGTSASNPPLLPSPVKTAEAAAPVAHNEHDIALRNMAHKFEYEFNQMRLHRDQCYANYMAVSQDCAALQQQLNVATTAWHAARESNAYNMDTLRLELKAAVLAKDHTDKKLEEQKFEMIMKGKLEVQQLKKVHENAMAATTADGLAKRKELGELQGLFQNMQGEVATLQSALAANTTGFQELNARIVSQERAIGMLLSSLPLNAHTNRFP